MKQLALAFTKPLQSAALLLFLSPLFWAAVLSRPAAAQSGETLIDPVDRLQTDLQFAVCRNDWQQALLLLNRLIGSDTTPASDREQLLRYRNQVEDWRSRGVRFASLPNCGSPAVGIANPLPAPPLVPLAALSPAQTIDVASGTGSVVGSVSSGQQVYSFSAIGGNQITAEVNVTRMLPGRTFTDDDSQLFLFDSAGRLLAENDDALQSYESSIRDFVVPADGTYFAVVTTFNNDPILDGAGVLVGWEEDGSSHIEYELVLYGITPTLSAEGDSSTPPQLPSP